MARQLPLFLLAGATVGASLLVPAEALDTTDADVIDTTNATGLLRTVTTQPGFDLSGPFFQDLGTNGRSCVTCHQPSEAWSVSAAGVRDRFERTSGLDPLFRLVDGANSPNSDVRTAQARKRAYSMLLNRGVFRVERPIPPGAEFDLAHVDDPYGYATAAGLSLFRRPLPSTNLRFISTVMWDGRMVQPSNPMLIENSPERNREILLESLFDQALDATNGHAEAARLLTHAEKEAIVDFELGLATAQVYSNGAGWLNDSANGGPEPITSQPFYIGINDNVADPFGAFTMNVMTLFTGWKSSPKKERNAIERGQRLFNTKEFLISGVKGLNDNPYFGSPSQITGTCTTCHNTPNIGNHSLAVALDIGLTDESRRTPDMPLYTLRNKSTGEILKTTDPGLALSTGKWSDIGRFKGPILRGLSARAPYFHDGSAAKLRDAVLFYDQRFNIRMSAREISDMTAFLESL